MFDAAIFDWDGTLADSLRAIVVSFHNTLREHGLDVSTEYIERRIGIGASDTFRDILRSHNREVDEHIVSELVARKSEIQVLLADEIKLFDGAIDLLVRLQGKLRLVLASMNNRAVLAHLLKVKCLDGSFEFVITGDEVSRSKPDPEIFLRVATELNVDPGRCVVFEDSIFGIKAAKAAGMKCVAVTTGVYNQKELEVVKPDLVVETLSNPKIFSFILA